MLGIILIAFAACLVFKTKDDAATDKLATALPREVSVRRADIGGIPLLPKGNE
jgi:hypothetical protein